MANETDETTVTKSSDTDQTFYHASPAEALGLCETIADAAYIVGFWILMWYHTTPPLIGRSKDNAPYGHRIRGRPITSASFTTSTDLYRAQSRSDRKSARGSEIGR